ncbi:hypothetical protein [Sorangium sp. So ce1182]
MSANLDEQQGAPPRSARRAAHVTAVEIGTFETVSAPSQGAAGCRE